jgi:hypothetical protein
MEMTTPTTNQIAPTNPPASDQENWRIEACNWNKGIGTWKTLKAMKMKATFIGSFTTWLGLASLISLVYAAGGFAITFGLPVAVSYVLIVFTFGMLVYNARVSHHYSHAHWLDVEAEIIDLEIKEPIRISKSSGSGRNISYMYCAFRLLCVYQRNGQQYRVTPGKESLFHCKSEDDVHKFLEKNSDNNKCQLIIHPEYPLYSKIGYKRKAENKAISYLSAIYVTALGCALFYTYLLGQFLFSTV